MIIKKTIVLAVVLASCVMILSACQESLEEKAAREARTFTESNCPSHINESMILDSMTYEPVTRTLHYYYRLTGVDDIDRLRQNAAEARRQLLRGLKNDTSLKNYKDGGFNFAYTYVLDKKTDEVIYDFDFSSDELH
jgi:hypothetical protein